MHVATEHREQSKNGGFQTNEVEEAKNTAIKERDVPQRVPLHSQATAKTQFSPRFQFHGVSLGTPASVPTLPPTS